MTLDDSQKQTVRQWIEEGLKVADIQVKLAEEFDITMTYMEVRFLVDESISLLLSMLSTATRLSTMWTV